MSGSIPSWMNSAQAHYLREDYERAEAKKEKASAPPTEAEALRAYKAAYVISDPSKRKQLEALAQAQGWTSLAEYKTAADARAVAYEAAARRTAESITSPEEATRKRQAALDNGDRQLANAISTTIKERWNTHMPQNTHNPANFDTYTAQLHEDLMGVVTAHDSASQKWRPELDSKRVTNEYVSEQIKDATEANRAKINDVLEDVKGYLNAAQSDFDQAYKSLTTVTGDTNEQLLAEIRAGKTWERTKQELDALGSDRLYSEALNRIGSADPSTLGIYMQELPSYLASKGINDAADTVRHAVTARPELHEAQARLTKAAKLHTVVQHNAGNIDSRLNAVTNDDTKPVDIAYVDPTTVKY